MAKGKKKTTVHKKIRSNRPSGKAYKQHPQEFSPEKRKLVPAKKK